MRIQENRNYNLQFTSKCCPIKPFTISTERGNIHIFEVSADKCKKDSFIKKMIDFFFINFVKGSEDPAWLQFQYKERAKAFKEFKKSFYPEYRRLFSEDDGHITMLMAKNDRGEICGGCLSYGFDEVPASQNTTLYVDSLAVDEKYRGLHLGKILLEKSIEAGKGYFTDVFLHGEKLAGEFYKKLGFKELNPKSKAQKKVIDYIAVDRFDYPEYIYLFTKPLQANKPRWYKSAAKAIDKLMKEWD